MYDIIKKSDFNVIVCRKNIVKNIEKKKLLVYIFVWDAQIVKKRKKISRS